MTWTSRVILTAFAIIAAASAASAHHIRGLPHYGYSENYPETPVFDTARKIKGYELMFSYYEIPGKKSMDLAFHIKDTTLGRPYDGPLYLKVYADDEDPADSSDYKAFRNMTNTYKVGWVYELEGSYTVRLRFGEGEAEVIEEFPLIVGEPDAALGVIFAGFAGVVVLMAVVAVVRKRRRGDAP